ncbi:hypothetical protein [Citrobacter freundii]|uniref:hypothetical protein n=1 Tax=Citrobacter freundii TaxID=546 RepID=UPI000738A1A6|nr:hypothetical protein [Citrobacter freundii]QSB80958.1 hypothetical protein JW295_24760 [Citrobacter freundii]QSB97506.1 hypothetical protein JW298_13710 [Citrobacter freundii]
MNSNQNNNKKNLIIRALTNKNYIARTIDGIAKETNLSRDDILKEIHKNTELSDTVKIYPRKSKKGDYLFTTKERFYNDATITDKFIDFFSTKKGNLIK